MDTQLAARQRPVVKFSAAKYSFSNEHPHQTSLISESFKDDRFLKCYDKGSFLLMKELAK